MGQKHPRADLACCVNQEAGGLVGTLCRVDLSPVVAAGACTATRRAALVDGLLAALASSNRRLGLVSPRPSPAQFGRVLVLVVAAAEGDIPAALRALPFMRRGPKDAASADVYASDVVSTDAFAIPGFGDGWAPQGQTALCLAGPVHVAVLSGSGGGVAPAFALVVGENHAHADGCAVPGGDDEPACASGLQLINAIVRAPGSTGGAVDIFVEADARPVPRDGTASLLSVVERALLVPCAARRDPGCPARSQVRLHPVDGRSAEGAWAGTMEIAAKSPAAFLDMWRDIGGEAGLIAAVSGLGQPDAARRCRDRLNAFLAQHDAPLVADGTGARASRLQRAVDTLREQGREGLLEAAFAAAGPLPGTVWRRHVMAFVVELEALAVWLDRRVCSASRGMVLVGGAFHTRRMVSLLAGLGMSVAFEKESAGHPVSLDATDLDAVRGLCGVSLRGLLAPSCLLCRPHQGSPRQGAMRTSGLVVAGCQAACWVVRRSDNCAVGLVVYPAPRGSVAAMLDPYFLHVTPYDAAALAISSALRGDGGAEIVAVAATDTPAGALAWDAAEVLPRWAAGRKVAKVCPLPPGAAAELGAVDLIAMFVVSFASVANTFPLAVGDFRDPVNPRRFAEQIERLSGGALTAPWGHSPPKRPLAAPSGSGSGSRVPVAAGALLPVPAGADPARLGVPVASTYPAQVGVGHGVPWGVRYETPDVIWPGSS